MNKYERALNHYVEDLKSYIGSVGYDDRITTIEDYRFLKKLVKKETPVNPIEFDNLLGKRCPLCLNKIEAFDKYCKYCGQHLQWGN